MKALPIALTPKKVLLVGAGKAAAQKRRAIEESDCGLVAIAREVADPSFAGFPVLRKAFEFSDLEGQGFDVVVNATGDAALSAALWEKRKQYGYLLNCVDDPKHCDFYFGATVRDHDLCVMVGSGGASPAYAQKIRDLVGEILPRQPASFYAGLRAGRQKSQGQGKAPDPAPAPAQAADPGLAAASLPLAEVPPAGFEKLPPAGPGPVFLVGCGPGKRAHLTLEALRLLPTLEVALVDALAGPEIVDLLSPACQKIDVGKRKGRHTMPQEAINALLLAYARRGFRVGRLKGGDPLAFGRLQEEVAFLQAHGIEAQVLCGVGSFQAGAAAAGIFPTVRGASQGFAVVSAHLREALFNDSWLDLLRAGRFTVAVLMAHSFAGKIVEAARAKGIGLDMPCAFVSQIDREGGQAVFGRLGELEAMARRCAPPAVLFIGPAGALPAAVPCTEGLALP